MVDADKLKSHSKGPRSNISNLLKNFIPPQSNRIKRLQVARDTFTIESLIYVGCGEDRGPWGVFKHVDGLDIKPMDGIIQADAYQWSPPRTYDAMLLWSCGVGPVDYVKQGGIVLANNHLNDAQNVEASSLFTPVGIVSVEGIQPYNSPVQDLFNDTMYVFKRR